jgi:hypothetical protein
MGREPELASGRPSACQAAHGPSGFGRAPGVIHRPDKWVRGRSCDLPLPVVATRLIPRIYRRADFPHRATPWKSLREENEGYPKGQGR